MFFLCFSPSVNTQFGCRLSGEDGYNFTLVRLEIVMIRFTFILVCFSLLLRYGLGQPQQKLNSREDLAGLYGLRSSLGIRSRNWPRKQDPCINWTGISCQGGRVVGINLSGLRRTRIGRVNPKFEVESLVNLTRISSFNSSGFILPGSIPSWFGLQIKSLRILDLSFCNITGIIPITLGNLQNLTAIYLSGNLLNGIIPENLGQLNNLKIFNLSRNSLTGNIPSSLSNLGNLTTLDLSFNLLSGSIPISLGTVSTLEYLILNDNGLSASIPAQFGDLRGLRVLNFEKNSLSGSLPSDLRSLTNLQILNLGNNSLQGDLPEALFSDLRNLTHINLRYNKFSGKWPRSLWSMPGLRLVDISFNNFTGILPDIAISNTEDNVPAIFNLSSNQFYGNLTFRPGSFALVDLSANYFEGTVSRVDRTNVSVSRNCLQAELDQRSLAECETFYDLRNLTFIGFRDDTNSSSPSNHKKNEKWKYILGGVLGGSVFIILMVLLLVFCICRRQTLDRNTTQAVIVDPPGPTLQTRNPIPPDFSIDLSKLGEAYTHDQLLRATKDFDDAKLIKHGHSGDLYRGTLENGIPIVVKRIDTSSSKNDSHMVELDLFGRISHSRLVPLLGHCLVNENEKFLVYKYMRNSDLSNALFKKSDEEDDGLQSLDWITRLKIATGAAEALAFLHECTPPLVHRDVQASSILLDDKFEVRLGSLSEVRVQGESQHNVFTKFLRLSKSTEQDPSGSALSTCSYDVYCLGKVLLVLVTGNLDISGSNDSSTNEWLEKTVRSIDTDKKESVTNILDRSLIVDEDLLEEVWAMAIIAKSCLNPRPSKRPFMRHVVRALENPLKVVREESDNSGRLRNTSSRGSWHSALFGSWRQGSDVATAINNRDGTILNQIASASSHGSGHGGDVSFSHKRIPKEIFPEPDEPESIP